MAITSAAPLQSRIAQIIQAEAQEAGFKVTMRQTDATSLITVLQRRDYDICYSPWSGRPDPGGNMYNRFTKDGPNSFAGWQNDQVHALLKQARLAWTSGIGPHWLPQPFVDWPGYATPWRNVLGWLAQ